MASSKAHLPKNERTRLRTVFAAFATRVATAAGSPIAFSIALAFLIGWALSGPYFDYSEAWQLVINTGTTIVTFMMVFVIQNSQNREGLAVQIKLDEIIRALGPAKNSMIDLECLSEEELAALRARFAEIAHEARMGEETDQHPSGRKPENGEKVRGARRRTLNSARQQKRIIG